MKDIVLSIVRFTYQPGRETLRISGVHYSWRVLLGVLVVTGLVDMADPSLYSTESLTTDILLSAVLFLLVTPLMAVAASAIMKWLFSITGFATTLTDNVMLAAWSGAVFTTLMVPAVWLSIPFIDIYEFIVTVCTLSLAVIGYRALTHAGWLHIMGTFIALGFVVMIPIVAVLIGLDMLGFPVGEFLEV